MGGKVLKRFGFLQSIYLLAGVLAGFSCGCGAGAKPALGPAEHPAVAEAPPEQAAAAPLRRLTQDQYRNTIRDLLGLEVLAADLPVDEGVAGFFSNTIAPVSELHLEKYGRLAELLARQAGERIATAAPAKAHAQHQGNSGGYLVRCPATASKQEAKSCGAEFVRRFGLRAFRRPLSAEEIGIYEALFAEGHAADGIRGGLVWVLQAMLQSPSFLYLSEPAAIAESDRVVPVGPYAMAARLSYYLWNSTPDEILLAAAAANRLATREDLRAQAERMMRDPRFEDTIGSFHLQWLDLTELDAVEKRRKIYPLFTPELREAMKQETLRYASWVIRERGGAFEELMAGRRSRISGPLYELYGLGKAPEDRAAEALAKAKGAAQKDDEDGGNKDGDKKEANAAVNVAGDETTKPTPSYGWHDVDLGPANRAGILTQASVLTRHAHWDNPSLVLRGKLIREKVLCTDLPPPPPDVNNTLPKADPTMSTRERFEDHRGEVSCAKCHRMIDPLGIPFENFDGVGAFRTMDGPAEVDPSSEITGTAAHDGPTTDAIDFVGKLAKIPEVRDCVALQWFRFATGRLEQEADAASLQQAKRAFRESGYKIPDLVAAMVLTDSFRFVGPSPPEGVAIEASAQNRTGNDENQRR